MPKPKTRRGKVTPKETVQNKYPKAVCVPVCYSNDEEVIKYGVFLKADLEKQPDMVGKNPAHAWQLAAEQGGTR